MAGIQQKCCPTVDGLKLTYVDPTGYFYNKYTNSYMLLVNPFGTYVPSDYFGKCTITQVAPTAYGVPSNPIGCPCCPSGYTYNDILGYCTNPAGAPHEPVPCIVCVCPDPVPPPPCEGCTANPALPIKFTFDDTTKQCTDCEKKGEPRGTSNATFNRFMATLLIDPTVIFKLRQ